MKKCNGVMKNDIMKMMISVINDNDNEMNK